MDTPKRRIRRRNPGTKKLFLMIILVCVILLMFFKLIVPMVGTASRYAYTAIKSYYLTSKEFYFNSTKLSANEVAQFESDNWAGTDKFSVEIAINTLNNLTEYSKVDVTYDLNYSYALYDGDDNMYSNPEEYFDFSITGDDAIGPTGIRRTIYCKSDTNPTGDNFDNIRFTVDPTPASKKNLKNNDYIIVKITANSVEPFTQTLQGEFKIIVGSLGMSYEIDDTSLNPYLNLVITNTRNYYLVDQEFSYVDSVGDTINEAVGQKIFIDNYLEAISKDNSIVDKAHSLLVTLDFDPTEVVLDTTSEVYLNSKPTDITYTSIDSVNYVNSISFKVDAEESKVIKFYKKTAAKDYTYPGDGTSPSVITVTDHDA